MPISFSMIARKGQSGTFSFKCPTMQGFCSC